VPLGEPFVVGDWRIHPKADHTYLSADTLAYSSFVIDPQLNAKGEPQIEFVTALLARGKELARTQPRRPNLTRLEQGLWAMDNTMPLDKLPPGYYRLRVELTQTSDGTSRTDEIPIWVAAAEPN
jgi:hypothetical protein